MRHVGDRRTAIRHRAAVRRAGRAEIVGTVSAPSASRNPPRNRAINSGCPRSQRAFNVTDPFVLAASVGLSAVNTRLPSTSPSSLARICNAFPPPNPCPAATLERGVISLHGPSAETGLESAVGDNRTAAGEGDDHVVDQRFAFSHQEQLDAIGGGHRGMAKIKGAGDRNCAPGRLRRLVAIEPRPGRIPVGTQVRGLETRPAAVRPPAPATSLAIPDRIDLDLDRFHAHGFRPHQCDLIAAVPERTGIIADHQHWVERGMI